MYLQINLVILAITVSLEMTEMCFGIFELSPPPPPLLTPVGKAVNSGTTLRNLYDLCPAEDCWQVLTDSKEMGHLAVKL